MSNAATPTMTADTDAIALGVAERLRRDEGPTRVFEIALNDVGAGRATVSMVLNGEALNGFGTAHGGVLFTLADTAFAYACNSRDVATVGQSATIAYLSPGRSGERITAKAAEVAVVGRSGSYLVVISGEDGRVIATFQGVSRAMGGTVLIPNEGTTHG